MVDWTEKYRPRTLSEVRGNDKSRDALLEWAQTWEEHREAVIVHGRPGVGKTSAVHAMAADLGWDVIELNASDQRTADVIERVAGEAARSGTLTGGSRGRKIVLLDEADNLHGNADRGGAAAITRLIREANQPIVLVANEFYELSNTLRNACQEIEFRDVSKRSILPVLRDICRREDIEYDDEALEALADQDAGDLRSAINDLQAIAEADKRLTTEDVVTGNRDRTEGIFQLLEAVLQSADARDAQRLSYDVDETPDDVVNWIEDNMPKEYDGDELADGYEFLARADGWLARVRATQNYRYWRYARDDAVAGVAAARSGTKSGWTRYGPPSYWRKLGSSRGARDTRDSIARRIADRGGFSIATARVEVLPYLAAMTHHCRNRELTIQMAAAFELDEDELSFVTGSGADTNKVADIVDEAERRRSSWEDVTDGSEGVILEQEPETDAAGDNAAGDEERDAQSGLSDFL